MLRRDVEHERLESSDRSETTYLLQSLKDGREHLLKIVLDGLLEGQRLLDLLAREKCGSDLKSTYCDIDVLFTRETTLNEARERRKSASYDEVRCGARARRQ